MGVRKNYRNLTDVERDRFLQALLNLKSTGIIDEFAQMHAQHFFMGIHRSSHFLPWHREMLLRFEQELQIFHPDITIPYWDSTVDNNQNDPLFWNNNFLGQFNSLWRLRRALGSGLLSTAQAVDTNQNRSTYGTFWPELENPIHNRPHNWVGGVMADLASPGDPVFYLHHCWIDMLWAKWQLAHPGVAFESSGANLGLNDPLMEWPDRTPANVLNHHALGYTYDFEAPRIEGVAAFQANTGFLGVNINGTPSSWIDTDLGMMAGTSPSISRQE
ncbi:MAG: tyrosinase family protein [Nitrosomonas sp.]|nr:MAG: tyrosinase family protein [Nitrosomonas sp.]